MGKAGVSSGDLPCKNLAKNCYGEVSNELNIVLKGRLESTQQVTGEEQDPAVSSQDINYVLGQTQQKSQMLMQPLVKANICVAQRYIR